MNKNNSQCRENFVTVNDYLTAKIFEEDKTDKIIIASDLRKQQERFISRFKKS